MRKANTPGAGSLVLEDEARGRAFEGFPEGSYYLSVLVDFELKYSGRLMQ